MLLGAHVSIAGGAHEAVDNGLRIGCDVIQIFTKNQRQWAAKPYSKGDVETFRAKYRASGLRGVVAHDSYLINLASPDPALWKKSLAAFTDEAQRCDQLGVPDLVFHPGAHMGEGVEKGSARIAEAVRQALAQTTDVRLDLECMAGHGSTIGNRLEDLARILELVGEKKRVGVCLDTCHLFAAGYDLATPEGYAETMKAVERTIRLPRVKAFHLNDSKGPLNCRLDRHEDIGKGHIGKSGFSYLMNDERFAQVPMNLETPGDDEGYVANLKVLRGLIGKKVAPTKRTLGSFTN
jgi:deoxyribonuclease IV